MPRRFRFLCPLLAWLACGVLHAAEPAAELSSEPAGISGPGLTASAERLQVAAPFLEMHTGPGRGYPVFFVVERRQFVTVELRRTDWYKVRAAGGQVGWVQRAQLESTLTEAGGSKTFRDLLLDDYLGRRVEFGGAWGRFKGEPMLKLWLHYRLADTVGAELAVGQVQGLFSGTDFWHVSLTSEPWSDSRLSPFFAVGLGKFANLPNASLVNAVPIKAKLAVATVGARWHISERFVARLDWSLYTAFASETRSTEYRSVTAGFGFFF